MTKITILLGTTHNKPFPANRKAFIIPSDKDIFRPDEVVGEADNPDEGVGEADDPNEGVGEADDPDKVVGEADDPDATMKLTALRLKG